MRATGRRPAHGRSFFDEFAIGAVFAVGRTQSEPTRYVTDFLRGEVHW